MLVLPLRTVRGRQSAPDLHDLPYRNERETVSTAAQLQCGVRPRPACASDRMRNLSQAFESRCSVFNTITDFGAHDLLSVPRSPDDGRRKKYRFVLNLPPAWQAYEDTGNVAGIRDKLQPRGARKEGSELCELSHGKGRNATRGTGQLACDGHALRQIGCEKLRQLPQ